MNSTTNNAADLDLDLFMLLADMGGVGVVGIMPDHCIAHAEAVRAWEIELDALYEARLDADVALGRAIDARRYNPGREARAEAALAAAEAAIEAYHAARPRPRA